VKVKTKNKSDTKKRKKNGNTQDSKDEGREETKGRHR
jgi:hypothetical protein